MLNGQEIAANGWITNFDEKFAVQQHGIDLRVDRIGKIEDSSMGHILKEGPVHLPQYEELQPVIGRWVLLPGYYQVSFLENMTVPKDKMATIIQRSSAARCGIWILSSIFDAGFSVKGVSTFFEVHHLATIEKGARLAQVLFYDCTEVTNLYQGSFVGQGFHE